jgi:hypothetical protein
MKILYIAHERQAAQVAAQALRRMAPDVRLTWARTPTAALSWIRANTDAYAVFVEPDASPGCDALLEEVRGLGVTTPIAVMTPDYLTQLSAALDTKTAVADQRLAQANAQHDAALARITRICTGLQERLLELEAALHGADERHTAQTAAAEQLARREAELVAAVAEAAAVRAVVEQRLADAETACCSFFTFTLTPLTTGEAAAYEETVLALDIEVPINRADVLAALVQRAEQARRAAA